MKETDTADGAAPPDGLAQLVDTWWSDHFPGSPVAQVTQAWNHAFAAKEELKRRLVAVMQRGQ
ncbi:MAG: hypothetical protein JO001_23110 [Alphaproteobacteria bacterium]|nr:hypothetical protein [Alphaproteobacteria bacterium]